MANRKLEKVTIEIEEETAQLNSYMDALKDERDPYMRNLIMEDIMRMRNGLHKLIQTAKALA